MQVKKKILKLENSLTFILIINMLSLIQIIHSFPKFQIKNNSYEDFISNNSFNQNNLDQKKQFNECFTIINDTTIIKNSYFYKNNIQKELCFKLALSLNYKEDIYFPKYFHKCFPLCNSCSFYSSKSSNMQCISCLLGFKLENGNCYINKKFNETTRTNELSLRFNKLNLNKNIISNFIRKKYINGKSYLLKENQIFNRKKLSDEINENSDYVNNLIEREDQSTLTNDKTQIEYNFHIELSPYYILAEICISKGKFYIENNRCVDSCNPRLESYFGFPIVEIKVGPDNRVTVCDCAFRCCIKKVSKLSKSLDRGKIDGSFGFFRRKDGGCINFGENSYLDRLNSNYYILAQDYVPCFFPIYNDLNEVEYFISGYQKTVVGNGCKSLCPQDDSKQYYYYNPSNSGCYKCPENCIECNDIPTSTNGHCISCKEGYNIIYHGFCYDICPFFYGEKDGTCIPCNSDEIYVEGKCVRDQGNSFNYGDTINPSFPDENNSKIFHKCLEYIGNKTYIISKDKNPICTNVQCPYNTYNSSNEFCYLCPDGCAQCYYEGYVKCPVCLDGYERRNNFECIKKKCLYYINVDGQTNCYTEECPNDYFFLEKNVDDISFECIPSCNNGLFNYYRTLTKKCKVRCDGEESSVIEPEHLCLSSCTEEYPENIDGFCENCALKSQYNHNGVCVYKDDNFDEIYFILSGIENEKFNKVGSCYTIDERGDYHPEHIKSREYNPSLCPDDCPSNFEKKVDSNGNIYCLKCYFTCETCEYTGSIGNHKCTKCKTGYEFSKILFGVCDQVCNEGEYFYFNDYLEKKCVQNCPDELPYMSESDIENDYSIECISDCTKKDQLLIKDTFSCVKECPEGFKKDGLLCVEECPIAYGTFGNSIECIQCNDNNLYYYNGKCYDQIEGIPIDTYILDSENHIPEGQYPQPGVDNDGILHYCFTIDPSGDKYRTGYFSQIQNCSKKCPENYKYDESQKKCIQCEEGCLYCDEDGCLDECPENYYMALDEDENILCTPSCPADFPIIDIDDICTEQCSSNENKVLISGNEDLNNGNYECTSNKCKDLNLYYNPTTKTCYPPEKIPLGTFFNPDNQNDDENELSLCLNKISDNEYITGFFYSISRCNEQCPENFYYAGNNRCKKCHSLCKTCFDGGTNRENNCLSCLDSENRILNPYLFNCEKKCDGSFHYSEETKRIVCDNECPKNNYIDEQTGECISQCRKLIDSNYCVDNCPEGKSEFNGYCLPNITTPVVVITKTIIVPNSSPSSSNNNNEIDNSSPFSPNNNNESAFNINSEINDNIEENIMINKNIKFINIIKNIEINIKNETLSENTIRTENGNISICQILMNQNNIICGNSENILHLDECQQKIKENYPLDNSFYLLKLDIKEKNFESEEKNIISSQSKYKIYRANGEEVDINQICKNSKIKIEKDLTLKNNNIDNEELYKLIEEGVNIFDINDPFFNDICYPYTDENGNDIPLKNRREDIYQNTVVCIKGCKFSGYDTDSSKATCVCDADSLLIKKDEEDNSILGYFDDNMNGLLGKVATSDTIGVIKCYERTFKKENIKKNIGFWIYMGFLGLFLSLLSCLLCYGYDSLNSYLLKFENEKKVKNEEIENEVKTVTKKVVVSSSYSNMNANSNEEIKNISSNDNSNPPKRGNNSNEDIISEEKTRSKTIEKLEFGFNKNKNVDYSKLNISNFGKGYKLSNQFDAESIDLYHTPTKLSKSNISSQNSGRSSSSLINSKIENNTSKIYRRSSQVELEPDGALLAANNFFDTCRIVKVPQEFTEEENISENYIINKNNQSATFKRNSNAKNYNNSNSLMINKSAFYHPNNKVVNLPGFPDPYLNKENSEEEKNIEKKLNYNTNSNSRSGKWKESNRYLKNDKKNKSNVNFNQLEDIDERIDDSSYLSSENTEKANNNKNDLKKNIIDESESCEYESINQNNNRYNNRNSIKSSLPKYKEANYFLRRSSLGQPITINKYYISNEKFRETEKNIDGKSTIGSFNRKGRKSYSYPEKINSEEKEFKRNKNLRNCKNGEKTITITTKTMSKKSKKENTEKLLEELELDSADFEEVMLNDKRSFCAIFGSFLSNFQIYISTCFSKNIFVPWVVRASICLFTIELYFTLTALLMKITQFEKRYKSKKDIDIIYLIKNEFSNIIYTTLITKVMNFVAMYIFVHHSISKVIKDYAYQGDIYIRELKNALYKQKCKYYIFMVIFIILTCLQGYFISCFCTVYIGSIKEWIYSSLISFALDLIISFVFIFLAALFRSISICCQSWLLFMISNFFLGFA